MYPKHSGVESTTLGGITNNPASPFGYETKHDLGEAQVPAVSSASSTCDISLRLQSESTESACVM